MFKKYESHVFKKYKVICLKSIKGYVYLNTYVKK